MFILQGLIAKFLLQNEIAIPKIGVDLSIANTTPKPYLLLYQFFEKQEHLRLSRRLMQAKTA